MAQASYTIPDSNGITFLSNLNALAQAVQSTNAGPAPPADTAPGMLWLDTSAEPPVLRLRNAADDAWTKLVPDSLADLALAAPGLVGRSAAGAGPAGEIAIGNGLSLSAGILAATGGAVDEQIFTASGVWSKPAGVTVVHVEAIGGGQGGVASRGTTTALRRAGGGSGGLHAHGLFRAADLGSTVAVTVGAGGASVTLTSNGVSGGNPGGTSSFGSHLIAPGGGSAGDIRGLQAAILAAGSGGANRAPPLGAFGGLGGFASGGSEDVDAFRTPGGDTILGGAGGGCCSNFGSGGPVPTAGGRSLHDGDGGAGSTSVAGDGGIPGGGGGGAASGNNVTAGAGARGEVRIRAW